MPKTKSEFVGRWALACTKTEVKYEHRNAVAVHLAAVRVSFFCSGRTGFGLQKDRSDQE